MSRSQRVSRVLSELAALLFDPLTPAPTPSPSIELAQAQAELAEVVAHGALRVAFGASQREQLTS